MRPESRHCVIAGTGRAGTTFLVEFLTACGLDTGKAGDGDALFRRARAGREIPFDEPGPIPYVVKDPWLFNYCHALDLNQRSIDALIIPIRDLWDAAESRCHQARIAMADSPAFRRRSGQWTQGLVPGGVKFSLDAADQANVLAKGLHELLFWATDNDIPILLTAFPRMVRDAEYLVERLWPWLGAHCDRAHALEAFAQTARPDEVRVKAEKETAAVNRRVARAEAHARALGERVEELLSESGSRLGEVAKSERRAEEMAAEARALQTRLDEALVHQEALHVENEALVAEVTTLRASKSWRLTRPLRALRGRKTQTPAS